MFTHKAGWKDVEQFYSKLCKCTEEGEWIGAYVNLQLSILSCKQLIDMTSASGSHGRDGNGDGNGDGDERGRDGDGDADATALNEHDLPRTMAFLLGMLPRYKGMVKRFQSHFGCPPKSSSDQDSLEAACVDLKPIDVASMKTKNRADVVMFETLIGNKGAIENIKSTVIYPFKLPQLYPNLSKGMLFYGPAGTGKTLLAKATAFELFENQRERLHVLFYAPTADRLKGKYVGETEKKITDLFRCASDGACKVQNKVGKPTISIIFIDEIDSIARSRSGSNDPSGVNASSTNTLLQNMDGISSYPNVLVMSATNLPWDIDSAILRRFSSQIYVSMPSKEDICLLLKHRIAKWITRVIYDSSDRIDKRDPTKCAGFDWADAYDKLNWLHGIPEKDLKDISATLKIQRFSPRDIEHLCSQVFMAQADRSTQNGGFHEIRFKDGNGSSKAMPVLNNSHYVCMMLQGKYVSASTYQNIQREAPEGFDKDSPAMYPTKVKFPLKIVHGATVYKHFSTISISETMRRIAKRMPEHLRIYYNTANKLQFILHMSTCEMTANILFMGEIPTKFDIENEPERELLGHYVRRIYILYKKPEPYVIVLNSGISSKDSFKNNKLLTNTILKNKKKLQSIEIHQDNKKAIEQQLAKYLVETPADSVHDPNTQTDRNKVLFQIHHSTSEQNVDASGASVLSKCCNFSLDLECFHAKIKSFTVANSQTTLDQLDSYHRYGTVPSTATDQ